MTNHNVIVNSQQKHTSKITQKGVHNMEQLPHHYGEILSLIPVGKEKLISTREIEQATGFKARDIHAIINDLIMTYKIAIGSSRDKTKYGYFIPTNEEEKLDGIASLEEQTITMQQRAQVVRSADIETAMAYKLRYSNSPTFTKQLKLNLTEQVN